MESPQGAVGAGVSAAGSMPGNGSRCAGMGFGCDPHFRRYLSGRSVRGMPAFLAFGQPLASLFSFGGQGEQLQGSL